ncbi:MAG: hypothetical protein NWF01_04130 [Candidatus Bathyarchaeota archaeon]|nr:hypothetical protein [Candidatus Bathyarchaeota archaeon]
MRKAKMAKNIGEYVIKVVDANSDGSFACPKCSALISPEDETETTYEILETKIVNDELAELVVSCAKCKSTIKVTGFNQVVDIQ